MRPLLLALTLAAIPAQAGPRVVGGQRADAGEWPDAVAVKFQNTWQCTGTLVAPNVVFTAGHCNLNIQSVLVGSIDYSDGNQGEEIPVIAAYESPDSWNNYDFAVLVLERDAASPPRPVATSCVLDNHLYEGAPVAVVGFGSTRLSGAGGNTRLMEAFVEVDDPDCSTSGRGCNASVAPGGEIIAGGGGVDSCNGDSGGPLYLDTPDGYFLVGITSRAASPLNTSCGDGGIYVRADAVIDWAEEQTGIAIDRPDCDNVSPPANRPPRPTAPGIDVMVGESGTTTIAPNDSDAAQTHTYAIDAMPAHGSASVDVNGVVTYQANDSFVGGLAFSVTVTDNGDPVESGTARISVSVDEEVVPTDSGDSGDSGVIEEDSGDSDSGEGPSLRNAGCSCSTPAPLGSASLLALLPIALLRRRRS
ncbi:MAG: trypsin-like serine protease [Proteobacteria bacterium]|nr:trypsin-like serine protease [Pseudomonadota bacterium]